MKNIEQLFRKHYPKMFLVAKMLLGDEEVARDLVSDAFADMLSGKLKLPAQYSEGFFVVLIRNRCMNHLRHLCMQDRVKQNLALDTTIDISHSESSIVKEIDQEMSKADQVLLFIEQGLTPQTSRIVKLHYREKKTYRQISEKLGISETAVYKHLAQGIKKIKEQFNPKNNGKD